MYWHVPSMSFPALFFLGFALFFLAFTNDTSEHQIWFLACSTFARRIMHGFRRQEHARNTAHGIYPCRCLHHPHYFRLADETPNIMRPMMTDCPRPPVSPSAWSSMAPWSGTCPAQHIRVHQRIFTRTAVQSTTADGPESRQLENYMKLLIATLVSSDPGTGNQTSCCADDALSIRFGLCECFGGWKYWVALFVDWLELYSKWQGRSSRAGWHNYKEQQAQTDARFRSGEIPVRWDSVVCY